MSHTISINGNDFKSLLTNGCQNLINDADRINALNVFPVPDGDTGTNMRLTIEGGVRAIVGLDQPSIGKMCKEMSRAMTMSARGNSGVILSQFFKGFSTSVDGKDELNIQDLVEAYEAGVKRAYTVVQNPTEGTMLTVMREATEEVRNKIDSIDSIETFYKIFLNKAAESLENTPNLLDVLKEAGVIDSGGAGYLRIMEGFAKAVEGDMIDGEDLSSYKIIGNGVSADAAEKFTADSVLTYGYCTEFILQLQTIKVGNPYAFQLETITKYLETVGDSIVAFKDDDIIKVHVHTKTPGQVIDYCQQFGEYVTFKMENMSIQYSEMKGVISEAAKELALNKKEEKPVHKKYAIVAVSQGSGITAQFLELGVDKIVSGGQTMNPSSEDFIKAFDTLDAENIFVFPNNSNIILAAKQAADNYDKANVIVLNSKSINQCYSALAMMDLSVDNTDEIVATFNDSMDNVISIEITHSIRDTHVSGIDIHESDYIGIKDHNVVSSDADKIQTIIKAFESIEDLSDKEVFTIFKGKDGNQEEIDKITEYLKAHVSYPEIGVIEGEQDIYDYLISVE